MSTTTQTLLTPILDGGVRNTHFFQGRLLTAEDLRGEQDAHRQRHRQIGRALGAGVVEGLEVRRRVKGGGGGVPSIEIRRGIAITGEGQVLSLARDTEIALAEAPPQEPALDAGLFADCQPPVADPVTAQGGVFVLLMSPASGFREQAPKSGVGDAGKASGCGSRWAVEGVSFRLQQVFLNELTGISEATRGAVEELLGATSARRVSLLRSHLAHLFFGTEQLAAFTDDPFARREGASLFLFYGALADLAGAGRLTACDVPLALVYWAPSGVEFVDMWAVRRRPSARPPSQDWPTLTGARRRAEAEAVLLQFQSQLEDLLREVEHPETIRGKSYFRYLPPAGFFPLFTAERPGLTDASFFDSHPLRQSISLEAPRFDALVARSFDYAPLDLEGSEPIWLYQVLQGSQSGTVAEYRVFARAALDFEHRPLVNTRFVPNLFGKSVAEARELLAIEQFDLRLGTVLDIYGNVLNPEQDEVQVRLVLTQTPQPKALVPQGSSIQVAVTARAAVAEPAPEPVVVQYNPAQVRPGDSLAVIGANFGPSPAGTTVTFTDVTGLAHTVPVESRSTASTLHVVVPADVPSPPAGNTALLEVTVTLGSGDTADGPPLTLLPPPALVPQITGFPTSTVIEGDSVTLTGTSFDEEPPRPTQKTVFFGARQTAVSAASATSITVTVPDLGLPSTSVTQVPTKVIVDGEESNVVNLGIQGYQPPPPPPPPAPVISSFSPVRTVKGNNVTIYGSHFDSDHTQNEVYFGTKKLIPSSGSTGSLLVYIPLTILPGTDANYHTFAVKVRANGQYSNTVSYQVADFVPQPPPEEPPPPPGGEPF